MKWKILLATSLLLVACDKQGPLERAGEKVDNAAHDLKKSESVGDKIGDAAHDLKKGGENVADKIGDAADDTRDAVKKAVREAE